MKKGTEDENQMPAKSHKGEKKNYCVENTSKPGKGEKKGKKKAQKSSTSKGVPRRNAKKNDFQKARTKGEGGKSKRKLDWKSLEKER